MSIFHSSVQTLANAGSSAGAQTDARVAQLAGGGHVVAWTSSVPGDPNSFNVVFRLFDANGNPTSGVQQASAQLQNNEQIQDIIANPDGTFTLAYTSTGVGVGLVPPTGYGATGTLEKIGIVQSFNSAGVQQGTETKVFITGTHDQVDSMKLVSAGASANVVYFGQSNLAGSTGQLFKSANISTTGPGTTTATAIKNYTSNVLIEDVQSTSGGPDALVVNGEGFFSTNTSSVLTMATAQTLATVQAGIIFQLQSNTSDRELTITALTGSGNAMAGYAQMGSTLVAIPSSSANSTDTVTDAKAEALGGGRTLIAWQANNVFGSQIVSGQLQAARSGIYGIVFNANTMQFEGQAELLLSGNGTTFSMDVLTDGRVAIAASQDAGFFGGAEIISRIVDPRVAGNGSTYFTGISLAQDTAGFRLDLANGDLNTGAAAAFADEVDELLNYYDNVVGGSGADSIYGDDTANTIRGGGGDDLLDGRGSVDTLFGEAGNDTLNGGASADSLDGGTGNDAINGGSGNDTLFGGDDNDVLLGSANDDFLDGGAGDDVLNGGSENDRLEGGIGNDRLQGGAGDDVLSGGSGNDAILDGDGEDTVDAGSGNDTVFSGEGADVLNGGTGVDTVTYASRQLTPFTPAFLIDLDPLGEADIDVPAGTVREDLLTGFENVTGSAGDDIILGSSGVNLIKGGDGDDLIYSRNGLDVVFGGLGNDRFHFGGTNEGNDKIKDFSVGNDDIQIVSAVFGDTDVSNILARFVSNATGAVAANGLPQFTFDNSGTGAGTLRYDADGNGAGAAVIIATLTFGSSAGMATFGATDFVFV